MVVIQIFDFEDRHYTGDEISTQITVEDSWKGMMLRNILLNILVARLTIVFANHAHFLTVGLLWY